MTLIRLLTPEGVDASEVCLRPQPADAAVDGSRASCGCRLAFAPVIWLASGSQLPVGFVGLSLVQPGGNLRQRRAGELHAQGVVASCPVTVTHRGVADPAGRIRGLPRLAGCLSTSCPPVACYPHRVLSHQ